MGTTPRLTATALVMALLLAACTSTGQPQEILEEPTPVAAPDEDEAEPTDEPTPEPTSEPVEGSSSAPVVTDLATIIDGEPPADGWTLDGGAYTHESFGGLAFDIPRGTAVVHVYGDSVGLTRSDFAAPDDLVWIVPAAGIVPPDRAGVHIPHGEDPLDFAVPVPDDLGSWLDAVPQAEVLAEAGGDAPAGAYGWWDVVIRPELGPTFSDCGHQACIHNVVDETGASIHADVWTVRYAQSAAAPSVLVWSQEREGTGPAAELVESMAASASLVP